MTRAAAERLLHELLAARLGQLRPYELLELLALPVEAVSDAYGGWVRRETTEVIE